MSSSGLHYRSSQSSLSSSHSESIPSHAPLHADSVTPPLHYHHHHYYHPSPPRSSSRSTWLLVLLGFVGVTALQLFFGLSIASTVTTTTIIAEEAAAFSWLPMEALKKASRNSQLDTCSNPYTLDRLVTYGTFTLDPLLSTKRRQKSLAWHSQASFSHAYLPLQKGVNKGCVGHKNHPDHCYLVTSLQQTQMTLLQQLSTLASTNPHSLTLIMDDVHRVTNLTALVDTIPRVPNDWDVIRWNCQDANMIQPYTKINDSVFSTNVNQFCTVKHAVHKYHKRHKQCWYCGQLHAYVVKPWSIPKLRQVWNQTPYDDIDCRLTTTELNSYCVTLPEGVMEAV